MGKIEVHRNVEFDLTIEEIAKKATMIAELSLAASTEENKFKAEREEHKATMSGLENDINKEIVDIRARKETRHVICDVIDNFEGNAMEYWTQETPECPRRLIESRAMEARERQGELQLVEGGGDPEKPENDDFEDPDNGDEDPDPDDGEAPPHPDKLAASPSIVGGPV